ncbi:BTB/POZ domain-containing protein 6-like [Oculina patagonica]
MSFLEKNWQTTRPTIRERSKYVFNNDLFSDVKFVVQGASGENESIKQVIPAHKFVLSISSPVFEAMFYGEVAETRDSIELPDCEYESMLELFRYMYSDEVILNGNNVMGVLYLAKKYIVPSLADKCMAFLQDNLDPSNVFNILPHAQKYEEKNLVDKCWEVIDGQAEEAVKSDGFLTIERCLLEEVVERDALNIEEVELFKAVNLWATKKCEEQGLSTDGSEKRRILGERIVKEIRFPVMTQQEFAGVVLDCNILTPDEAFSVVKFFNSVLSTPVGFSEKKRNFCQCCCRFGSVDHTSSGYPYLPDQKDCLFFTVNKDISLLGVTLCGSENNKYSVTIHIKNLDENEYIFSKSGTFSSVLIKPKPAVNSYYGFTVLFDRSVFLKKDVSYLLEAFISGANSCIGQNGKDFVLCSGVRFDFKDSGFSDSGTKVAVGQFPGFHFTIK